MAKKRNKNSENGFVPIRRGIYEHLNTGKMTGEEWMIYSLLHLKADHQTGVCWKISAPTLAKILRGENIRSINRRLTSLEVKGYIKRINHRGQVPCYPVVINKFRTSNCLLIDAHNLRLIQGVTQYLKGDLSFNCLLSVLSTISKQDNNNKRGGKKPSTPAKFIPPTSDEVTEYAQSIGYQLDGKYFCERYAANEWKLKNGNPMKNWKQSVVTWKHREQQGQGVQKAIFEPQMPTEEQLAVIEGTGK